jgi:hypothetical protein
MLTMRFETKYRRYAIRVYRDLFGDWIVCRTYGGKQNNLGGMEVTPYRSEGDAIRAMTALAVQRVRRKYQQM